MQFSKTQSNPNTCLIFPNSRHILLPTYLILNFPFPLETNKKFLRKTYVPMYDIFKV